MRYLLTLLSSLLLTAPLAFAGVTIVQCEDDQGEITFQKTCPPGTSQVGEKRVPTGASASGSEEESGPAATGDPGISALLYTASECGEPCDKVRTYLAERNIAVTEKNATDDWDVQNEIKQLIGELKVPVTKIGNNTITGYNAAALRTALNAAGYSEPEKSEATEAAATAGK